MSTGEVTPPDKPLFTPGPLTTSRSVKESMLRDLGSRDEEFLSVVARIRGRLLSLAGASREQGYEAIPVQGSGTYGLEAVVSSLLPPQKKLLCVVNGAYGERLIRIAEIHQIPVVPLRYPENGTPEVGEIDRMLERDADIATVSVVHCETTSGVVNPVEAIGKVVRARERRLFLDSMSGFGALPVDLPAFGVDILVSSANKCIEGVPGFCFVLCRRDVVEQAKGWARTLSLDLRDQWVALEATGQFRFTPPTHALLAFDQALNELEAEGGPAARCARYAENQRTLVRGMERLGFRPYLSTDLQGPIITSFHEPPDPRFSFERFYELLNQKGFIIYPGKISKAACFRIGTIGHIDAADVERLVETVESSLRDMGLEVPLRE